MSLYASIKDLPQTPSVQVFGIVAPPPHKPDTGIISTLTRFIPTELLAPYAAALSIAGERQWDPAGVYYAFVIATPFALVLFSVAKAIAEGGAWPKLPPLLWRAVAATLAFAVWALAVPSNPFQDNIGGAAIAGFLAMVVSPVLEAVDRIALRLLNP